MRPTRSSRKEARPSEILAAALHLFAGRGYAATRLDDVAAAVGVSKGTLYLYFPNKEQLFQAVVREHLLPNLDGAAATIAAFPGSTAELMRLLGQRFGAILQSEASVIPKLVIAEAQNFPSIATWYVATIVQPALKLLQGVLQRGVDRGEFRPLDPRTTLPSLIGPFLMMALWKHSLAPHEPALFDPPAVLANHIELVLRAIAAEPEGSVA